MKMHDITFGVEMDLVRVNYECSDCKTAYTESQHDREITPACGRCGGPLEKLTLVIGRRENT